MEHRGHGKPIDGTECEGEREWGALRGSDGDPCSGVRGPSALPIKALAPASLIAKARRLPKRGILTHHRPRENAPTGFLARNFLSAGQGIGPESGNPSKRHIIVSEACAVADITGRVEEATAPGTLDTITSPFLMAAHGAGFPGKVQRTTKTLRAST